MIIIKKSNDKKNSWAMPFVSGSYYNVHWKWGIDFTHLAIAPNMLWDTNDGIVLRFNYTDNRELFEIGKWYQQSLQLPFLSNGNAIVDPATCSNGDYFQDDANRYLYVCVSGRNKAMREWIDVNGIRCRDFCPVEPEDENREDFFRLWSNATMWPNGVLPAEGENVTVPFEWKVYMDIDPPQFYYLEVNGLLIFNQTKDSKLEAKNIWVKNGRIIIGSEAEPFTHKAEIILHGEKDDPYVTLDPDASGNKMLAVTGGLFFYGKVPATVWTRLTAIATVGATSITVE